MKKLYFFIIISLMANRLIAQNIAPNGIVTNIVSITNPTRINDGNTGTSATIAPYTGGAWFTIELDDVYYIKTIEFISPGSASDMYLLFLSETGEAQDFLPYGDAYFDPPTSIAGIYKWVKAVKFMVDNTSSSNLYIQELRIYASDPPILFGYDDAGNRTNRTIEIHSNLKKGALDEDFIPEEFSDNLEELSFKMYPNPTKGLLTVEIENFTDETRASISIYDLQGRLIHSIKNATASNAIDLSNHSPGTYVMVLKAGDKTSEWKIVKE